MARSNDTRWDRAPQAVALAALLLASGGCGDADGGDEFLAQVKLFDGAAAEGHAADDGHDHSHDILTPLDAPVWVEGAAAKHLRADDPVLGYLAPRGDGTGEQPYAIPWWVLKNYHVANVELEGEAVCITLCERCSSAAAWDPVVDGQRLHLRVKGIYDGTHVCFDDTTQSWFTPFTGRGMHGPLKGRQLARKRLDQATWGDWLELHPTTRVTLADEKMRLGHGSEDSPGSKGLGSRMRASIRHHDSRLPENELILGVVVGGVARAYPMARLSAAGSFVAETVGGVPIIVFHKPGTWLAAAFRAELDGKPLRFERAADGAPIESGSQSRFLVSGAARGGTHDGRRLVPVEYGMEEWYIWATQHPGSELHGE